MEPYKFSHLSALDETLAHEYGDNADPIKLAIHWCITGNTAESSPDLEWQTLGDVCVTLAERGLTTLADKIHEKDPFIWGRLWQRLPIWTRLAVIDLLLDNHGVEHRTLVLNGEYYTFRYSNSGDYYITTIGYDLDGKWYVCGWFDYVKMIENL